MLVLGLRRLTTITPICHAVSAWTERVREGQAHPPRYSSRTSGSVSVSSRSSRENETYMDAVCSFLKKAHLKARELAEPANATSPRTLDRDPWLSFCPLPAIVDIRGYV